LNGIGDYRRQFVREIRFSLNEKRNRMHDEEAMYLLRQCTSIKRLDIVVKTWYPPAIFRDPKSPLKDRVFEALRKVQGCQEVNVRLESLWPPLGSLSHCNSQQWKDFARGLEENLCKER
jgi:hypothetical protein